METPSKAILFKLPQILTRSQAKLNINMCQDIKESVLANNTSQKEIIGSTVNKRITRSTSKGCTSKTALMPYQNRKKKTDTRDICGKSMRSDSGYGTSGSCTSRDAESVGSRESGVSELLRSLEGMCTDDSTSDMTSPDLPPSGKNTI